MEFEWTEGSDRYGGSLADKTVAQSDLGFSRQQVEAFALALGFSD